MTGKLMMIALRGREACPSHAVRTTLTLLPLLAVAFGAPTDVHAQSPVDVVRARNVAVEQALASAPDPIDDETREELKNVINGLIDFVELSRRALGRHWDSRTDQEKVDFVDVFRQLIRNSSVERLGIYRADEVGYAAAEYDGDEAIVVTSPVRDGKSVEIVYHMHQVDGGWKAFDIVVDGSSTVRTYRDSFNRQIDRGSFASMYEKLVERLKDDS